jgi:hypothetical protein
MSVLGAAAITPSFLGIWSPSHELTEGRQTIAASPGRSAGIVKG